MLYLTLSYLIIIKIEIFIAVNCSKSKLDGAREHHSVYYAVIFITIFGGKKESEVPTPLP